MSEESVSLSIAEATHLATRALEAAGANGVAASATARALVQAEVDGQSGHGLSRVSSYAAQVASGKVNGGARPRLSKRTSVVVAVDAEFGFAYPALDLAIAELVERSKKYGVAAAFIQRSHHFGQAGAHVERLADGGALGFLFGNSPKGVAFWGSAEPMMGTNPIAFAAPTPGGPPIVVDLAISTAARGKILAAKKTGQPIPEGWALDADGEPTTDAEAALAGSMVPIAGAKGAALAFMVEILAAAATGSNFGFEASSLFNADGEPPNLGQTLVALDADVFAGSAYWDRMDALISAVERTSGARTPGSRRLERRAKAQKEGIKVAKTIVDEIRTLGEEGA